MSYQAPKNLDRSVIQLALTLVYKTANLHRLIYIQMLQNLEKLNTLQQTSNSILGLPGEDEEINFYIMMLQQQCEKQRKYLDAVYKSQDDLLQQIHSINSSND
ncbi:hypothetical protein [Leptolyngbya sp. FACHB-16]|nr:hypothetical protein [Leptolyngbya sp. FACHB-16]MBD1912872.1 hypothetical protein [Leptolyngbya sp. FACHB-8]MBD2152906.1 hypothetical protein [Leptolyngbya sp. FACHB-16]